MPIRPRYWLLSLICLCAAGCGTTRTTSSPVDQSSPLVVRAPLLGSLFPSDTGVLSNDAATAILDGAIELRAEGRLGLLPLGHQYGEDTGHAAGQHTLLSERLVPHPAIGEIVRIPRLLLPDRLTVPAVREVAARLRCENVLLYQITFRRQYRHHMLARDRIRIFVTVEAVVFNTRTGIIPCSVVIDRDLDIPQQSGEKHWDLWQRAEAEAALAVLGDAAAQIMADLR